MVNELYNSLIPHIVEHGYKLNEWTVRNSNIDRLHAVISHLHNPERYFVFLGTKSFLIRKYDDKPNETSSNRRPLSSF